MTHLKGNQWRQSKRAVEKKERAKHKSLGAISDNSFENLESLVGENDENKAIVIEALQGTVAVLHDHERVNVPLNSVSSKRLRSLVPGDFVKLIETNDTLTIDRMLPRTSELARMRRDYTRRSRLSGQKQVIAANVDTGVIVVSAKNPPLHPKFIDRYLVLLQRSEIDPLICLNKSDLASDSDFAELQKYENLGIKTLSASTFNGEGINTLKNHLLGKMAVLVGHSGVGKTSLMNAVEPNIAHEVGELSLKTGRGQHTTTSSFLHEWEDGSYIIDTPGIRSLEVWDMDPNELQWYYPEIVCLRGLCKYGDCLHYREPIGLCAVKDAIGQQDGITQNRYDSYTRILEDLL